MAMLVLCLAQPCATYPDDVWDNVLVIGEHEAGSVVGEASAGGQAPLMERGEDGSAGELVAQGRLSRHVEVSIDDLVTDAGNIGQRKEVGRGETQTGGHRGSP